MKQITACLICCSTLLTAFAQFSTYYPDGRKIRIPFTSIKILLDSLGVDETTNFNHKYGVVYYKMLTDKPVFVLFLDKDRPEKIPEILAAYKPKYRKYLYSYDYFFDLNSMMKEKKLTKSYLMENFGTPQQMNSDDEGNYWIYKKYNLKIYFLDQLAAKVEVINYYARDKNQLAVSSYEVTGSEVTIGMNITIQNLNSKTIKYIYFTVTATNPVDDKVGTKTVRGVGPIKKDEEGTYEFDDIIYSSTAKFLSIDRIKIQYMDGSGRDILKDEVKNITAVDWEEFGTRTAED
jgi:hypothetical protein